LEGDLPLGIYEDLGIRRVINGDATLTALGGSIMPPPVVTAMAEAAESFVDIFELQDRVSEEIACLTGNKAAYVSCGAASALTLATAAVITGLDPQKRARLPRLEPDLKSEVIVHRHGRVKYEFAVQQVGVTLVEIGGDEGTCPDELEAAINERTAAIIYFAQPARESCWVPYKTAVEIAQRRDVPLIVDAAAQLPPKENLWRFTVDMGADLAMFSGGKGLCGPQSSGLTVGRRDLIEAMAFNGPPHPFIGRGMKVGKEEMAGLLAAVKWYLGLDHEALMRSYEDQVGYFREQLSDFDGVTVRRSFPSEAGQPMPRSEILLDASRWSLSRDELLEALAQGEPPIRLAPAGATGIYVNPQTLKPGEERIVARKLKEILTR